MYWTVKVDGGPRRVNHAAVAIGNKIYSFGGYCSGEIYDGTRPIDIHVLDTDNFRWSKVDVLGSDSIDHGATSSTFQAAPYQRYGHTVVQYDGKAYLWGGRNDDYGACNRMHMFDPCGCQWSVLKCEGKPPPARDGHSACVNECSMYIFGGYEESSRRYSCETYVFNFETYRWYQLRTTGDVPQWRDFHTTCIIDNCMYVFGGRSDQMFEFQTSSDVYCDKLKMLDLRTNIWSELKVSGVQPCGRRSHTACTTMFTINAHGIPPSARRRHCSVSIHDQVFLFGGTTPADSKKLETPVGGLSELADLHVLDYCKLFLHSPSLKTLSSMAVLKHGLQSSYGHLLPADLRLGFFLFEKPGVVQASGG
ncbi:unnamed protein product [Enterobius vermicularis]|uniref:BTB domain-containing protein n=1 Tax=Enterobius vermicularis TaxID=51028 RepID=A0A0N4VFW4_ENTVE|nr:unnamed protein product [Enterobius vermicularis]